MFMSKANSKQKWVKKHKKRKNRSPVSTHGPCQNTHGRAKENKVQARPVPIYTRSCSSDSTDFLFFRFHHFARKNQTVNRISVLFSPTRSLHLTLSYSTEKSTFQPPQKAFSKTSHKHLFAKTLNTDLHTKNPFSPKRLD